MKRITRTSMPSGSFVTFAWSSPASSPPPKFVFAREPSRPTEALSASFRSCVISARGASVSTSVEKTTTPQKSPGARWSTSFRIDCLA
nr:hypothetical protein [Anaeromyxobacter oryzae]